jgi:hypothetical protein
MHVASWAPAARWFLSLLIFDPEDGGETILRNVGSHTEWGHISKYVNI